MTLDEQFCRVCGLIISEYSNWYDGQGSLEICPCCECQAGFDDETYENTIAYRKNWIKQGCPWLGSAITKQMYLQNPETWNPIEQMKNIPSQWR